MRTRSQTRARSSPFEAPGNDPGEPPTTLLEAIDVSSNNPRDLTGLIQQTGADVCIVRMYLGPGWEQPPQDYSRDQVQSARDNGKRVVGYWWGYAEYSPEDSLDRAVDLASSLDVPLDVPFHVDHERYPPEGARYSIPGEAWLRRCGEHYLRLGIPGGLYGSSYMDQLAGNPSVGDLFAVYWYANYSRPPDDLRSFGAYGFTDEQVCAHQYGSTQAGHPCDVNRILSSAV